jgi:hypothetical protein
MTPAAIKPLVPHGALEALDIRVGYADGVPPCLAVPERQVPNGTRAG